jgi:hypothetical protein
VTEVDVEVEVDVDIEVGVRVEVDVGGRPRQQVGFIRSLLEVNPQNLVFHSQYDAAQTPMVLPNGPFGHEDWDPKLKSAVVVDRPPGGEARGYVVEVALPWSALTKAAHAPPRPGDEWRINLYAMRSNSGVAWSPILGMGNFHKASRFGRVTWR